MKFKAKLFKLGNSRGIYIPKSIYNSLCIGEEYEWEVYTKGEEKETITPKVYTLQKIVSNQSNKMEMCSKHPGSMKITCGCK